MTYLEIYIDLMKKYETKWKNYVIHPNGTIEWESHNGIVMSAKNPKELEEGLQSCN